MNRVWVKRLVVAVAAVMCTLTLAGGVDLTVLDHRLRHVDVHFPAGGDGRTWLLVGSDGSERDPGGGARADVILLVHLGAPRGSVISIPRDLLLRRPDGGVERAALMLLDGPQALVDGLCRTLGAATAHVAIVDRAGFADVVDALGGVTVDVPAPVRDRKAGLEIDRAGRIHVDGREALALVRSRHPEQLVAGVWRRVGERAGAVVRSRNAAAVFAAIRGRARGVRADPIRLQRTLWAAAGAITVDSGVDLTDLFTLLGSGGRAQVLPAAALPRTIAVLADGRTRAVLAAAGYPSTCTPSS